MCLCRCQNKDDIRRRLFQRFQKSIECPCRKHMHLVNDIHFVFTFCRTVSYFLTDLTDIIHPVVGSGINLDHIHRCACLNGFAHLAFVARTSVNRMFTVHSLRQNLCHCGLTGTTRTAEKIRVSDTIGIDLVRQRRYNMVLPFDICKIIGPEFSVQGSIAHEYTPLLSLQEFIFYKLILSVSVTEADSDLFGSFDNLVFR